jgi:fructokinase
MVVWSVGEVLWDVFPDQERFGGAPLNFCTNTRRLGDQATLLSAVGDDVRGQLALDRMRQLGLATEGVRQVDDLPTGIATIFTTPEGEPAYEIPRPAAFDRVATDTAIFSTAKAAGVDWLYFGTLLQTTMKIERFTTELARHLQPSRALYDMNLRIGHWSLPLVQRLSRLASVLKLNEDEAQTLFRLTQAEDAVFSLEDFCRLWASEYAIDTICVTLGPAGCLIYDRGDICRVPGFRVTVRDTVGSGDAFAAAFLHGYHRGWPMLRTARFANALGALVASRPGSTPDWTVDEVLAMLESPAPAE